MNLNKLDKIVLNWHITQACNFACKHCFATKHPACGGRVASSEQGIQSLLRKLHGAFSQEYNAIRLNIAGGEPLLEPKLDFIIAEAKSVGFELSMISNGSLLAELGGFDSRAWIEKNAPHLSLFGISVDSLHSETNAKIGRILRKNPHLNPSKGEKMREFLSENSRPSPQRLDFLGENLRLKGEKIAKISENSRQKVSAKTLSPQAILEIARLLRASNDKIALKINTVVTKHNYGEYFGDFIRALKPEKWKVLQALSIGTAQIFCENEHFEAFVGWHRGFEGVISVESREQMTNSYLMLDEFGRFYQNQNSRYAYSPPLLQMSADEILNAHFDKEKFQKRYSGGVK